MLGRLNLNKKKSRIDDRIFICYSRKDENFVLKLAKNLKRKGIPVWLDQWDIPYGADWNRTIDETLKECTRLLLILSPSSVGSDDVQGEWLSALDEGKAIVPILYRSCRIPARLKSIQYIDFTSHSPDDKEAIEQILKALRGTINTYIKPVAVDGSNTKSNRVRKTFFIAIAIVIFLLILLSLLSLFSSH
jgi:hypothetical protein